MRLFKPLIKALWTHKCNSPLHTLEHEFLQNITLRHFQLCNAFPRRWPVNTCSRMWTLMVIPSWIHPVASGCGDTEKCWRPSSAGWGSRAMLLYVWYPDSANAPFLDQVIVFWFLKTRHPQKSWKPEEVQSLYSRHPYLMCHAFKIKGKALTGTPAEDKPSWLRSEALRTSSLHPGMNTVFPFTVRVIA